jgi:hypothetical protein
VTTELQDIIAQARAAMRSGNWELACSLWSTVRKSRPIHPGAYTEGLECLIRAFRHGEIDSVAEMARNNVGHIPKVQIYLATLSCRRGYWQEALKQFEEIHASKGKNGPDVTRLTAYRQALLNTYGILEGNRRLSHLTHRDFMSVELADEHASKDRKFVFVSGMPRAGTTALGHVLNHSADVALFTEIHIPYLTYAVDSFDRGLLQNRADALPTAAPGNMLDKAETAKFVGDKRPLFHYMMPQTFEAMANSSITVFHMLRSVELVAASYQSRALNPKDQWDPLRGLENAIDEMNVMHRFILDLHRSGSLGQNHRLIYVDYNKAFSNLDYVLDLFEALGHPVDTQLHRQLADYVEHSQSIVSRSRSIAPEVLTALRLRLDREAAEGVKDITGIDVLGGKLG